MAMQLRSAISVEVKLLGFYCVLSAIFNAQLMRLIKSLIGAQTFVLLIGLMIALSLIGLVVYQIKRAGFSLKHIAFWFFLVGVFFASFSLKITAERFHIIQYGLLGFLTARDVFKVGVNLKTFSWAIVFPSLLGLSDELLQKCLPWRFYDLRDVRLNVICVILGVLIYWYLNRENTVKRC